MKKPKKPKKNPKRKWSKQCGDFLFKHCTKSDISFIIDVYFKNEIIGFLKTQLYIKNKDFYRLSIYKEKFFANLSNYGVLIGEAHCVGIMKNGIPKQITHVNLTEKSILVSERMVLVEKYQSLEKQFGHLFQ